MAPAAAALVKATDATRRVAVLNGAEAPIMRDVHSTAAQHAALQFVLSSDIPATHKAVLIDTLTAALRDQETQERATQFSDRAGASWSDEETSQLQTLLDGKTARSWQHADELLMNVANRLGRDPLSVRTKATDLGFGPSVDYRLAKARARDRADHE
jgi:hypothetical protein